MTRSGLLDMLLSGSCFVLGITSTQAYESMSKGKKEAVANAEEIVVDVRKESDLCGDTISYVKAVGHRSPEVP
jgi:hypothetical protein